MCAPKLGFGRDAEQKTLDFLVCLFACISGDAGEMEEKEETGGMQQHQHGICEEIHSQRRPEERSLYPIIGFLQYPTTGFFVEYAQQLESLNTEEEEEQQQQRGGGGALLAREKNREEKNMQLRKKNNNNIPRRASCCNAVCRLESVSRTSSSFFVGSCCFHFQAKQRKISILYDHPQLRYTSLVGLEAVEREREEQPGDDLVLSPSALPQHLLFFGVCSIHEQI